MKYDCSKTLDCIHEYNRLCRDLHSSGCENDCPLHEYDNCCFEYLDAAGIALLQKWSDEHPEALKLTKEEYDFLASFMFPDELSIRKGGITMQLDTHYEGYPNATIPLKKNMFQFIEEGKDWTVEELLKLEVEE